MQYICFIGCRLPPLSGYVAVCLVLTIDVYAGVDQIENKGGSFMYSMKTHFKVILRIEFSYLLLVVLEKNKNWKKI